MDAGTKEWEAKRTLTSQTSGKPLYACRLGCMSLKEPWYGLLLIVVRIVGDGACGGYVDGSEGS
jgi:hypothetical protein